MNGSTIFAIRKATGYSITDLANACGVSERSVRRWEHNVKTNHPSNKSVEIIQSIYDEHIANVEKGVSLALDSLDNFSPNSKENGAVSFTLRVYHEQEPSLEKPYEIVNADTFAVADRLKSYGFNVSFTYNNVSDDYLPFADQYIVQFGITEHKELVEGEYTTLTFETIDEAFEAYNSLDPRTMFLTDLASKNSLDDMAGFEYAVFLNGISDGKPLDEVIDRKKYGLSDYIHESKN